MSAARAVVFAHHDVGVRCLKVLLSAGLEIPLVVAVPDDPHEKRWYASVAATAADYGLRTMAPPDPSTPELGRTLNALQPDFVFSFYYRALLPAPLLRAPRRGALNMHGSLLPKYRGRAPVNWAILKGERETGATLHHMVERADAGDIVDSQAVPILIDDDAREVLAKVTVAAEVVLARSLPALLAGTAPRRPQGPPGEYFGRRRPGDGRIDWRQPALAIHNLVRAVAPPFPGAFAEVGGERWEIHRTRLVSRSAPPGGGVRLFGSERGCFIACSDGAVLQLLAAVTAGEAVDLTALARSLAQAPLPLA